jgi:hypothetical protein
MKTVRNMTIVMGLALAVFGLAATSANAQTLTTTSFGGTFTLPFEAQWGSMTLPAGDYSLFYGHLNGRGTYLVEVAGKAEGSPHGMVITRGRNQAKTSENVIVCVREENKGYIRGLQIGVIGESATFKIPHGVEVRARIVVENQKHKGNTHLAQASTVVELVPIKQIGK